SSVKPLIVTDSDWGRLSDTAAPRRMRVPARVLPSGARTRAVSLTVIVAAAAGRAARAGGAAPGPGGAAAAAADETCETVRRSGIDGPPRERRVRDLPRRAGVYPSIGRPAGPGFAESRGC